MSSAAQQRVLSRGPPEYFWRANPRARIIGFSASQHAQINAKIDSFVAYAYRHKQFSKAVEFNTIPVVLENARFKKSFVPAGGRGLLSVRRGCGCKIAIFGRMRTWILIHRRGWSTTLIKASRSRAKPCSATMAMRSRIRPLLSIAATRSITTTS